MSVFLATCKSTEVIKLAICLEQKINIATTFMPQDTKKAYHFSTT